MEGSIHSRRYKVSLNICLGSIVKLHLSELFIGNKFLHFIAFKTSQGAKNVHFLNLLAHLLKYKDVYT